MTNIEREFDLLREYMAIYIQLLPYTKECSKSGWRYRKAEIPSFQEYKDYYRNFWCTPHYKDAWGIYRDHVFPHSTKGLGTENGFAYRGYNYFRGVKFFPPDNPQGNYTIVCEKLNDGLKKRRFDYL